MGCGKMGTGMMERLLGSEEAIMCWNRTTEGAAKAAGAAMTAAKRGKVFVAGEVGHVVNALHSMDKGMMLVVVSDAKAATEVIETAVKEKARLGETTAFRTTLVNLTSGCPDEGRAMRAAAGSHFDYIDGCYCGPPSAAREGSGSLFLSADDEKIMTDSTRAILERLGALTYAGPIGASRALDYAVVDLALVNYISMASNFPMLEKEKVDIEKVFLPAAEARLNAVPASLAKASKKMQDDTDYYTDPVATLGTWRNFWASRLPYLEKHGLPEHKLAQFVIKLLDDAGAQDNAYKNADITRLQEILRFKGRPTPPQDATTAASSSENKEEDSASYSSSPFDDGNRK